ncbi:MAG: quinone-dependent dihydroorotate dehydrogenase [Solirubrobacteraceae bacterium]
MIYEALFNLALRRLEPERAHQLAFRTLDTLTARPRPRAWMRQVTHIDDELVQVKALGLTFPSPLGVAAGFDKDAEHFEGLGALGFGFVEVGTVTPRAQGPNPGRIIERLPDDRALLNRMGFPSQGAEAAARHLARMRRQTVVGVNIGKNRDTADELAEDDYRGAARILAPVADFLVLNVSSPNTVGLRDLQVVGRLRPLADAVREEFQLHPVLEPKPLLVKISPDTADHEIDAIAELALELGLDGIVATNTTVRRETLASSSQARAALAWPQGGGVSGAPLKARSLEVLKRLYARVGDRLVLVSVGGVESADDVWQRILSGATLVQSYTGLVYGGPAWPRAINLELARRTFDAGAESIQALVGSASAHVQ